MKDGQARTSLVSLAAIGSVLAATSCCLPVMPFIVAAGFAGGSAFLEAARPFLLAGSVLLIAYGFYQALRARKCSARPRIIHSVLLWASAAFVFVAIFFPQLMANVAAELFQ